MENLETPPSRSGGDASARPMAGAFSAHPAERLYS